MEADWEVEIGGSAIIETLWPGFIDLRVNPERAAELPEAASFPALAQALVTLNATGSPLWTSKCDLWPVPQGNFDPDELDAPPESVHALACYIDLLPRDTVQWFTPALTVEWSKVACVRLRKIPLHSCRVDLIVRRAILTPETPPDQLELGITAYLTACGATEAQAAQTLADALTAFATTLNALSTVE
jgi:hypothetical protein